jgi:Undecaprenyl-phosphate galactose phosphotransferase WbaP
MAHIGTIAPQHAGSRARFRRWQNGGALLVRRFRKPLVAASLVAGDVLSAYAAMWCADALLAATGLPALDDRRLMSVALLIGAFFMARLYTAWGPSPYERLRLRALCIAAVAALDVISQQTLTRDFAALLLAALCNVVCLLVVGHYVESAIRAVLIRLGLWGARAAIVACGEQSRRLAEMLAERQDLGLSPIGFLRAAGDSGSQKLQLPLPVVGTTADPSGIDPDVEVVLAASARDLAPLIESSLTVQSRKLVLVGDAHDVQSLWVRTRALGDATASEIRRELGQPHNRMLKRTTDVLLGAALGVLTAPIVAILAIAIKWIDSGPVFYVQGRVGRNGETVRVLKLRTMYADAEQRLEEHLRHDPQARKQWQRFFKLDKDPRILPVIGDFMRRKSLDELPQLWNVIRGDMSLVGPRPFPTYHMNSFDAEFQAVRTSVPPGITGMWQISSRSNGDLDVQKAQDLFYIRNWSLWLDIYILLETIPTVLSSKGAR